MNASKNDIHDFSTSVRQRLLNWSKEHKTDFQLTLVRYASERFLYRLSRSNQVAHFILKGALLFKVWTNQDFRSTRDVDFLGIGSDNHQAIRTSFETICSIECPEDGVQFDGSTMQIENICDEQEYGGIRVKLPTKLGQAQFPLQYFVSLVFLV